MSAGYNAIAFYLFPLKRTGINKHPYYETPEAYASGNTW